MLQLLIIRENLDFSSRVHFTIIYWFENYQDGVNWVRS